MLLTRNAFQLFFFFKQQTAYDVRISDGSSDVCSSDLHLVPALIFGDQIGIVDEIERHAESLGHVAARSLSMSVARPGPYRTKERPPDKIGRASCRERVCQDV